MRIFTIFQYTLLKNLRDRGSLLEMLLLPVVLIFILGTALNPIFQPRDLLTTKISYLNEDQGPVGSYFDDYLAGEEIAAILEVYHVGTREEGLTELREENSFAFIHLEEDYSQRFFAGEAAQIKMTAHINNTFRTSIVENILEGFNHGANATTAMANLGVNQAYSFRGGIIEEQPISARESMPGAMDYYAVTMLVMIIMYGAMYSCYSMGQSYLAAIGRRIRGTPIRGAEQYMGLVMANVVTVFAQVLILLAFTHYVYQVNWGNNLAMILLITFTLVLLAIGLGAMVCMLAGNELLAGNFLNILIPVFTFIAGGYVKISNPGPVFEKVQHLSPNYLAQTALFNTIYGGPNSQTMAFLFAMGLIILGTFALAFVAERRKIS